MIWIAHHQVIVTLIICYIFSSIASALPTPDPTDGKGYKFLFAFIHALVANFARIPQLRAMMGLQSNPITIAGIDAKNAAQEMDSNVQGVVVKSKE